MILQITLILSFTIISAYIDYEHLIDKDYIEDYASRVFLRGIFIIANSSNLIDVFANWLLFASLFDIILNLMRGNPFIYLGNTAYWDIFFNEKKFLYVITLITCFILGIYLFIK